MFLSEIKNLLGGENKRFSISKSKNVDDFVQFFPFYSIKHILL